MEEPGLSPRICNRCPPNEAFCPAHIDCFITECSRCDARACDDRSDRHDESSEIDCCDSCFWVLCRSDSCRRPEKRMLRCCNRDTDDGCYGTYCSDCCPSEVCRDCGRRMNE